MKKNILIIFGHPRKNSLCGSFADAYGMGAKSSRLNVRRIDIADLKFNPILYDKTDEKQLLEKHIKEAQKDVKWADHIVFIFPTWWASMPALLKGFMDRTFVSGFAYQFKERKSSLPEKLLTGKTARLLITMDSPPLYYRFIAKEPGYRMMKDSLGFMGIKTYKNYFGPVKTSEEKTIASWINSIHRMGAKGR
ncbi:MAG: NAD(P)H-dependent oxidoreductase [Candidatus Woesearchaeota archaeon]